jgi:hypothetical protein
MRENVLLLRALNLTLHSAWPKHEPAVAVFSHRKVPLAVAVACGMLLAFEAAVSAQQMCPGDVDGDGEVTTADVDPLLPLLFDESFPTSAADANADDALSAADIVAIELHDSEVCPQVTPTATPVSSGTRTPTSRTASPTPTPTRTAGPPTATRTPRPTSTPTAACTVQPAQFGTINGELTVADCQRDFGGTLRYADEYSIAGTPGQAIKVDLTATGSGATLAPFLAVIDADGEFDRVEGVPPIQFLVSATQPYQIFVSSDPSTAQQFGSYQLTLTSVPCPTPVALSLPLSTQVRTLDGTECPDPEYPSTGPSSNPKLNPADTYTFSVPQVPMNIQITMRQLLENDTIDPAFSVLGPDGVEDVTTDDDDDAAPGGFGLDAQARFLALQPGTYTIIAVGGGGLGRYSLTLSASTCAAKTLSNIPPDRPLTCPGNPGAGCSGTLSGDTTVTVCAAPLPIPGISDCEPDVGSAADLYTLTTTLPGQVISVQMISDDDAHLYLLGPASAGNPLVAEDDDSGPFGDTSDSQLAATLVVPGTYTIVAANNNALAPPDPECGEPADTVNYTLYVQECPVRGVLTPENGRIVSQTLNSFECLGFGGVPFRTYEFTGSAGQFVTTYMHSDDVDAFLRVFAPDGTVIENDDDPFDPLDPHARANRILPADGTYYVEASTSLDEGAVNILSSPPPAFTLQAMSCPTSSAQSGQIAGSWDSTDCQLPDGQRLDVYTFPAGTPVAATIAPPDMGCVLGLMAEGPQIPDSGCSTTMLDMPAASGGRYGFILAGREPTTSGAYTAQLALCPLSTVTFGDTRSGALNGQNCVAANGIGADWFLVRGPVNVVNFNDDLSGEVTESFTSADVLTDTLGGVPFMFSFSDDPTTMLPLGNDLAELLRITGATADVRGSYVLQVDPAEFRQ